MSNRQQMLVDLDANGVVPLAEVLETRYCRMRDERERALSRINTYQLRSQVECGLALALDVLRHDGQRFVVLQGATLRIEHISY